jgi:SulP family sulfate permease
LSGPHTQPLATMMRDGFIDQLGGDNVCPHLDAALARASQLLELKKTTRHAAAKIQPIK